MRIPNSECVVCRKPLYRRPYELAKVRYSACRQHREEAMRQAGATDAQKKGLAAGRRKGVNNRVGYRHDEATKEKITTKSKAFWAANPERSMARGAKIRGPLSPHWKGGPKRLNTAVRKLPEYRNWADAVKVRDAGCVDCRSTTNVEADHVVGLADLLSQHGITSTEAARGCAPLWDVSNGRTLCEACHYRRHGRAIPIPRERAQAMTCACRTCGVGFRVKPSRIKKGGGKFCSRRCASDGRRKDVQATA